MIQLVNDNPPVLLLNVVGESGEINYTTTYHERQPYLNNPTSIPLSNNLEINDADAGPQYLVGANVTILNGNN